MSITTNKNYGVIENKKYLRIRIKLRFYHGISFFMLKKKLIEDQYGFKKKRGIRQAILCLWMVIKNVQN